MSELATMHIPKDVIEPIVAARISSIINEIFGNKGLLIDRIVERVLTQKVDSEGRPTTYDHGSKPMVEYEANRAIQMAVREALKVACEEHKEALKAHLVKQMTSKNSTLLRNLAGAMVDGIVRAAGTGQRWDMTINITETPR